MLKKDIQGRVLTDVHGRPMTTKDRWHPLVVSFIKRVLQDGGEIISPAIEEMNEMAWEGKFDDALYVYFAGARKAGKTYTLIPNDGSGDLDVERDSVAWEWEKYRTLDEIVNDMPEMEFDPATRDFKGIANRNQITNLATWSTNLANSSWSTQGTTIADQEDDRFLHLFRYVAQNTNNLHRLTWIDNIGSFSKIALSNIIAPDTGRYVQLRLQKDNVANRGFANFDLQNQAVLTQSRGGDVLSVAAEITDLGGGYSLIGIVCDISPTASTQYQYRLHILNEALKENTDALVPDFVGAGESFFIAYPQIEENSVSQRVLTEGSIATRLADDIEDIAVPMGATEIRAFVDGVETVIDSNLPATWEFPGNSTTKYVIIK